MQQYSNLRDPRHPRPRFRRIEVNMPLQPCHQQRWRAPRRSTSNISSQDARNREPASRHHTKVGDLLLQAVFFAQLASEDGRFDIADSLFAINSKLVRRHPHVFADGDAKTADDVLRRWDEIKAAEKTSKAPPPKGLLAGVPHSLPALVEAQKLAAKAAGAGFDWENVEQVFDKLREELAEVDAARAAGSAREIEDEIGDLLFVVVNIARFLKVDPEQALRQTNRKFRRRFLQVEEGLDARGKTLQQASLDEMEALWQAAKLSEAKPNEV